MKRYLLLSHLLCFALFVASLTTPKSPSYAFGATCCAPENGCSQQCAEVSARQTEDTIQHLKDAFDNHRDWMVHAVFEQNLLPALMLMTEQITAMAMHQVVVIGSFLDAKHQLETQRLFQELTARAHKDYQPSEGMCTFGTAVRSLAASDRNTTLSAIAFSRRGLQRELLSGSGVSSGGQASDSLSRIAKFRSTYCNTSDNNGGGGLQNLCDEGISASRLNKDIDYTRTFDTPLTLNVDFANDTGSTLTPDEEDVFALSANLYAHTLPPNILGNDLADTQGNISNSTAVNRYMAIRALTAKRSVARNSFASIAAMKTQGNGEAQPYLYAIAKEMGLTEDDVKKYLGDKPSYYAQTEVLTKVIPQSPNFYVELIDKPANVARKTVALQAIELMQRRDMYRSILRSESILSVMLESALIEQQEKAVNDLRSTPAGVPISVP